MKSKNKFAIEFAEWCAYYNISKVKNDLWVSGLLWSAGHYQSYTMKQLLKRFKKESNES